MLTLEQIKFHCRVDGDEEDELLEQYHFSALETLRTYTLRNWYEVGIAIPEDDPDGINMTPQAAQAVLLLIANWYANREAVGEVGVPHAFYQLVQPYRLYGV